MEGVILLIVQTNEIDIMHKIVGKISNETVKIIFIIVKISCLFVKKYDLTSLIGSSGIDGQKP